MDYSKKCKKSLTNGQFLEIDFSNGIFVVGAL